MRNPRLGEPLAPDYLAKRLAEAQQRQMENLRELRRILGIDEDEEIPDITPIQYGPPHGGW